MTDQNAQTMRDVVVAFAVAVAVAVLAVFASVFASVWVFVLVVAVVAVVVVSVRVCAQLAFVACLPSPGRVQAVCVKTKEQQHSQRPCLSGLSLSQLSSALVPVCVRGGRVSERACAIHGCEQLCRGCQGEG